MKIASSILIPAFCLILCACANDDSRSIADPVKDRQSTDQPTFNIDGTQYTGIRSNSGAVEAFLGIPFAQPPVGDLRWAAPIQLLTPTGARQDATNYGPACMQGPHIVEWYRGVIDSFGGDSASFTAPEVSEDCLYLNIWRPTDVDESNPLPVYVYVHGGSNKGGWSYEPNYIGEQLAARGVIVVTIAYRLGVFGFFSHPDLKLSNFALLDQIAALEWVKNNIQAVGGDPDKITVAGESSGASDIAYLLASPLAKGLFQRVVHQSAGWAMRRTQSKADADQLGKQLAAKLLVDSREKGISSLRKQPAANVLSTSEQVYQGHFYDPVIDGHSVTKSVSRAAEDQTLAPVDLLIGTNANEALMYLDKQLQVNDWIAENLPDIDPNRIISLLNLANTALQQLDQLSTAYTYTCPSLRLATAVADSGGTARVYYFSKQRDGELGAQMGAYHGIEIPYVFDTHDDWLPTSTADKILTDSIMRYWVQFMHSGDPNAKDSPQWPTYAKMGDYVMNLGVPVRTERHPSQQLCELMNP
ncbi:MAG: carboxylesterase family protein [Arenicella sp.]|nr:carboxylesterase family protein [Arenicella sp.]